MQEERTCVICNSKYITTNPKALCCGAECSAYRKKEMMRAYRKKFGYKYANKRKKAKAVNSDVMEIDKKARMAGMTYGQYVAIMEYGMAVEQKGE